MIVTILDMDLNIEQGCLCTKIYDKMDIFFSTVNCLVLNCIVSLAPSNDVFN